MGYRALVQAEDHRLLFLQQLGEQPSSAPFFCLQAHPGFCQALFWGPWTGFWEPVQWRVVRMLCRALCRLLLSNLLASSGGRWGFPYLNC